MKNLKGFEEFYKGKKVLITGHTGFKGTWLSKILLTIGAEVYGYALNSPTDPSLFDMIDMKEQMHSYIGDIRDLSLLQVVFQKAQPDIVIHMAAQPLVRESYRNPVETYAINVMGTVNVLECVKQNNSVKSVVNVTTDKVYLNREWDKGYIESDVLDGYDPYSNSKSCSELVTHSYIQSFLKEKEVAVSTCRAGNVLGGGDFATDRIIPDCIRAVRSNQSIIVRNPYSTRPYQHVLEPLFVYLMIAMEQYINIEVADCYNVGPEDCNCISTGELVNLFCAVWNRQNPDHNVERVDQPDGGPHEANFLKLNCTKLKETFDWNPRWSIAEAIEKVVAFEQCRSSEQWNQCMKDQMREYFG